MKQKTVKKKKECQCLGSKDWQDVTISMCRSLCIDTGGRMKVTGKVEQ